MILVLQNNTYIIMHLVLRLTTNTINTILICIDNNAAQVQNIIKTHILNHSEILSTDLQHHPIPN